MLRENEEVYQTPTVQTEEELTQAIKDRLIPFLKEVEETANGRTITVLAKSRRDDDGVYAHLRFQYRDEQISATNITKTRTVITEDFTVGVYSSPELEP